MQSPRGTVHSKSNQRALEGRRMPPNVKGMPPAASVDENLRRVMAKGRQQPQPTRVTKGSHPPKPGGAINRAARAGGTSVTGYRGH